MSGTSAAGVAGYGAVLRNRELVGLLAARLVSLVGDQLARLALSVLVYDRTGSTATSAAAYACTYLPALVAGPLLGGLADRQPRRRVLVTCDLLRAGLFGLMAVPGVPLALLLVLVLLQTCVEAPWQAARGALVRDVAGDEDGYQRGTGLDEALDACGQVCAFAGAGALLVLVAPTTALLLDVATFVVSVALVLLLVRPRPAADRADEPAPVRGGRRAQDRARRRAERAAARGRLHRAVDDLRTGWRAVSAPGCRRPVLLTWACLTATIAPEAVAAPWARELHAGNLVVGLLFAASPAGSLAAVLLLGRAPRALGRRLLVPLAWLSLAPLVLCLLDPPVPVALGLVLLSGVGTAFNLVARVEFVENVLPAERGRGFAVASTGVMVAQGLGIAGTALLALVLPPYAVVGATGVLGLGLLALALVTSRRPVAPPEAATVQVPAQRRPQSAVAPVSSVHR
jgi:MFS family permease